MGVQVIPVSVSEQALPGPHGFPYGLLQNSVLVMVAIGVADGAALDDVETGAAAVNVVENVDSVVDRGVSSIWLHRH